MKDAMKILCKVCLLVVFLFSPPAVMAQTVASGQVVDSTDEPIIGATVVEKGNPKNAAVTDLDGNFTLKLQSSKTVVISYIGMQQVEVAAAQGMKVVMQDDNNLMEEVVVIGYTSKARKDLTGSVGSVSGAKLALVPVASAAEALQGKIAGVQVTTVDGAPGADINIKIRGASTVNVDGSANPLFIVDGFQQENINDIPPTDIQSIDVLKDASLTAIYGSRGANGVVIVTTKSAQQGKLKVDFNTYAKAIHLAGKQEMLNTYEFVRYQQDFTVASNSKIYQFRTDFGNPNDMDIYQTAVTHDWQDEVMGGTPITQMYNVSLNGGNDKLRFSTSLTHHDEQGIIEGSSVRRTNMNTKINVQISPKVSLLINPRLTYRRDHSVDSKGNSTAGLIGILNYRPTNGLREVMGDYRIPETVYYNTEKNWLLSSPKEVIDQEFLLKHTYSFTNQASLTWQILDGLTFKSDIGQFWTFADNNQFYGYLSDEAYLDMPVAQITNTHKNKYQWTNTLNYALTLQKKHNLSFLLGQELSHSQTKNTLQGSREFNQDISPRAALNNMGIGRAYLSSTSLSTPDRMLSYFGQANYNYDHRYLVSFTMRADGSTRFSPDHRWGYFPSLSGAWVLTQEPFMKNVKWLSNFKIRAAYGMAGDNNIGEDRWHFQYAIQSNGGPSWGEATTNGENYYQASNVFPNNKIKWQTNITRNLAFDLGFFGDRLTITPEFYWNSTKDLLYRTPIPRTTGYVYQYQNIGKLTNRGIEVTVNANLIQKKDFSLDANLTMGYNKTKVDELNGEVGQQGYLEFYKWDSQNNFRLVVGKEIGLIYGYVYDGLYGFDEFDRVGYDYIAKEGVVEGLFGTQPGRIKFKDISGPDGKPDGKIDSYDRTVIGNTNPRLQGGFGFSGRYKNFDFNANFTYMLDFDVLNATGYELSANRNNSQTNPTNVLSKFDYAHRWVYFGDIYNTDADGNVTLYNMGEQLRSNNLHIEYMDEYERVNAGKTLWNPNDVTGKYTHSYFVEDASFLRLQDVTVGYTLPKNLTKKWGVERLRIYFTGSNLFCITNYSGYDPEVDVQNGLTPNVDYNRYPRSRGYLVGLNLTF